MKKLQLLGASAIVAGAVGLGIVLTPHHIGPPQLYPDAHLSPGLIATSNLSDLTQSTSCGTYSQCHRKTSAAQKDQVRAEYPTCPADSEIDHIVPLALGGADAVKNLWCQPAVNQWQGQDYGFHAKDKLENILVLKVKRGTVTPAVAQQCILSDWVACYQHTFGATPIYGGVEVQDPDTQ